MNKKPLKKVLKEPFVIIITLIVFITGCIFNKIELWLAMSLIIQIMILFVLIEKK